MSTCTDLSDCSCLQFFTLPTPLTGSRSLIVLVTACLMPIYSCYVKMRLVKRRYLQAGIMSILLPFCPVLGPKISWLSQTGWIKWSLVVNWRFPPLWSFHINHIFNRDLLRLVRLIFGISQRTTFLLSWKWLSLSQHRKRLLCPRWPIPIFLVSSRRFDAFAVLVVL